MPKILLSFPKQRPYWFNLTGHRPEIYLLISVSGNIVLIGYQNIFKKSQGHTKIRDTNKIAYIWFNLMKYYSMEDNILYETVRFRKNKEQGASFYPWSSATRHWCFGKWFQMVILFSLSFFYAFSSIASVRTLYYIYIDTYWISACK